MFSTRRLSNSFSDAILHTILEEPIMRTQILYIFATQSMPSCLAAVASPGNFLEIQRNRPTQTYGIRICSSKIPVIYTYIKVSEILS